MSETSRIANQLHRAYHGGAWHGPALAELLAGVTAKQAAARPLAGGHSIWELVLHITAWKKAVRERVLGKAIELSPREDWPPAGKASVAAWRKTLNALERAHRQLEAAVARLPDSRLKRTVPGRMHNVYFLLHGLVQHDLYHAGQVALLKKARRR